MNDGFRVSAQNVNSNNIFINLLNLSQIDTECYNQRGGGGQTLYFGI